MEERRQQMVVSVDDLRKIMMEVVEQTNTNHFCHLSHEERHALQELSRFLKRLDNTKWAFALAILVGVAMFFGGALWLGIKQLVSLQK